MKGVTPVAKPIQKAKKKFSAAGLANIRAAQKARWAKVERLQRRIRNCSLWIQAQCSLGRVQSPSRCTTNQRSRHPCFSHRNWLFCETASNLMTSLCMTNSSFELSERICGFITANGELLPPPVKAPVIQ